MAYQSVFKRYEIKYLLDHAQKERIIEAMKLYMALDKYGRTTIRNIYFDTENYRLIRKSIEKPSYKEKLRIRSYDQVTNNGIVFVELKKKYQGVVYKRRVSLPETDAMSWIKGEAECPKTTQITKEIDYFCNFYGGIRPAVFLSYEREAFYNIGGGDFRVTFDENILYRQTELTLTQQAYGEPILDSGKTLMEIKCSGGIPLWMVEILSREGIYKTSFSKYGSAYLDILAKTKVNQNKEILLYV